jgi:Ca-activated chloride channel family protein
MRRPWILQFGIMLLYAALAAYEQTNIRLDVNLVQLSVRVTDNAGHDVVGLKREAFRLYVDQKEQPITIFSGEDAPVTAGIVIDNSASMAPKREDVIASALAFARASNARDQMFVVHFNEHARFGLPENTPFSGSIAELEAAISQFDLGGSTALYDAILLAQSQFRRAGYGRKILLVITDGGDNSSKTTFAKTQDGAVKAGIVIYSVGIFDDNDHDRNPRALTELAESTGGEAFFPAAVADTTQICDRIAADIRRQYTLGFSGADDGQYHHIDLSASDSKGRELQVHTRPGYFAMKLPGSANRRGANRVAK